MRILFFTWKDLKHPSAGGAELVTLEISKRLVSLGHSVTIFTSRPGNLSPKENIDGVEIIRAGGRYSVYLWAIWYYFKFFRGKYDIVIDEINTVPFFTPVFVKEKKLSFFHQLAREVWFYEARFPISVIGYLLEPIYLLLYKNIPAITVSNSTKIDLRRYGINKVSIIDEALGSHPFSSFPDKKADGSLIFIGRLVPSKRASDVIKAFKIIKEKSPQLKLFVVGVGTRVYEKSLRDLAQSLSLSNDIVFTGFVSNEERTKLLLKASIILITSIKEGWGLVVTEAGACGTPAVAYNVDGLRDSVIDGVTGIVCEENTPSQLAKNVEVLLNDRKRLEYFSYNSWKESQSYTFEKTTSQFLEILEKEQ